MFKHLKSRKIDAKCSKTRWLLLNATEILEISEILLAIQNLAFLYGVGLLPTIGKIGLLPNKIPSVIFSKHASFQQKRYNKKSLTMEGQHQFCYTNILFL